MADRDLPLPAWARVSGTRRAHIRRVAALLDTWADRVEAGAEERARWLRAAALHDALKDAPAEELRDLVPDFHGPDALRHGPAAAERAARDGERDRGVLDAVRYHSVGYAHWDQAGRMLYLADFLEPGRHHQRPERTEWVARVPTEPDAVLRQVAAARIAHGIRQGWPLFPETVAFWNALVA